MCTGFSALREQDSDPRDSDCSQMFAAMGNHSEALAKLKARMAYCAFEPEWNLGAVASFLALEDVERAQTFITVAAASLSGADETALSNVRLQTLRQHLASSISP